MIDVKKEALRYLGYRGKEPDEATAGLVDKGYDELSAVSHQRDCYRIVEKTAAEPLLKGDGIAAHLAESSRVIFFAATLGSEADKLIRTAEIRNMAYALVLDALASAMTEAFCDALETRLHDEVGGFFTWRFSPGYGDYPIDIQPEIIRFLNADKLIGLTVTESNILIPRKSVTALIGVSDKEQSKGVRGCAACSMRGRCAFRSGGGVCRG